MKRDKVTFPWRPTQTGVHWIGQFTAAKGTGGRASQSTPIDDDAADDDNDYPYCRLIKLLWTCFYASIESELSDRGTHGQDELASLYDGASRTSQCLSTESDNSSFRPEKRFEINFTTDNLSN